MVASRLIRAVLLLGGELIWAQADRGFPSAPAAAAPTTPPDPVPTQTSPVVVPLNKKRILKIIPNYQTIEDSNQNIAPMTAREKWHLAWKNIIDPFNISSAALGAALSQAADATPKYGYGGEAMAKRFGGAIGDLSSQTFFSTGVFATVLHQDPRYFRKGPSSRIWVRVADSLKQIVVTRQDSGSKAFNASIILGLAAGVGFSNLYYPSRSRTGRVMLGRVATSLSSDGIGNLMCEFWPDLQRKLFRKKAKH
jgi:hypothetical protein